MHWPFQYHYIWLRSTITLFQLYLSIRSSLSESHQNLCTSTESREKDTTERGLSEKKCQFSDTRKTPTLLPGLIAHTTALQPGQVCTAQRLTTDARTARGDRDSSRQLKSTKCNIQEQSIKYESCNHKHTCKPEIILWYVRRVQDNLSVRKQPPVFSIV